MELRHIEHIRVIGDLGSFSLASVRLGVAQPTLSKIVRRVEDELGGPLFERGPQGASLTPFGEMFLERASIIEAEMQNLSESSTLLHRGEIGQVRIGAGLTWLNGFLPPILRTLYLKHPGIVARIKTGSALELLKSLADGRLDICCIPLLGAIDGEYVTEELHRESVSIFARRGHALLSAGSPPSARDLLACDWIFSEPDRRNRTYRWLCDAARDIDLPPPRLAIQAQDHQLILKLVRSTNLVAPLPTTTAAAAGNDVVAIHHPEISQERATGLVWRKRHTLGPALQTFIDLAREAAAPPPKAKWAGRERGPRELTE